MSEMIEERDAAIIDKSLTKLPELLLGKGHYA